MVEDEPTDASVRSNSLFDVLRKKHEQLLNSKTADIPIPGYDGEMVARYRPLDFQTEISKIGKRVQMEFPKSEPSQALYGAIDSIIMACVELGRLDEEGEFESYSSLLGRDTPIRFNKALADSMGWTGLDTSRDVVFHVFGDQEPMIISHAAQLNRWMSNITGDANASFLSSL